MQVNITKIDLEDFINKQQGGAPSLELALSFIDSFAMHMEKDAASFKHCLRASE